MLLCFLVVDFFSIELVVFNLVINNYGVFDIGGGLLVDVFEMLVIFVVGSVLLVIFGVEENIKK